MFDIELPSLYKYILFTALIAYFVRYLLNEIRLWSKLPPGPWGLPLVGYLPFLPPLKVLHRHYHELAKKYGDVFIIKLGQSRLLVLDSAEAIIDAFKMPEFANRPNVLLIQMLRETGESSLFMAEGPLWRFNRKVAQRALSLFNTSKNSRLEDTVHKGVRWLRKELDQTVGEPVETRPCLVMAAGAVLSSLLFGNEPNPEDPFMEKLMSLVDTVGLTSAESNLAEYIPIFQYVFWNKIKKERDAMLTFTSYMQGHMRKHTPNPEGLRDIADAILKAVRETPEADKKAIGLTDEDIRGIAIDLFDGGFFSTSEAIEWFLLFLATFTHSQKKLHEEIDTIVPKDRLPSIDDYEFMPYTRAVIAEGFRYASNTTVSLAHATTDDIWFRGYLIPKGTHVWGNTVTPHFDERHWDNPQEFQPERFIDKESGSFNMAQQEKILAFSTGKRRCPGEALAWQQLFLYLAGIMQKYEVRMDPETKGDPIQDVDALFTLLPGEHKLIFKKRF